VSHFETEQNRELFDFRICFETHPLATVTGTRALLGESVLMDLHKIWDSRFGHFSTFDADTVQHLDSRISRNATVSTAER
jgi:hypothetical protein